MRLKNIFKFPKVVGALNKVSLPNPKVVALVTGAVAKVFGYDIFNLILSQSLLRWSHRHTRQM